MFKYGSDQEQKEYKNYESTLMYSRPEDRRACMKTPFREAIKYFAEVSKEPWALQNAKTSNDKI